MDERVFSASFTAVLVDALMLVIPILMDEVRINKDSNRTSLVFMLFIK